ncbi:hypothetical protein JCM6882_005385 [Rhodosporidiobolus microsporus]
MQPDSLPHLEEENTPNERKDSQLPVAGDGVDEFDESTLAPKACSRCKERRDPSAPVENDDIPVHTSPPPLPSFAASASIPSPNLSHLLRSPARLPARLSPVAEYSENDETPQPGVAPAHPPLAAPAPAPAPTVRELTALRETREALCRAVTFGALAPLEKIKVGQVDVPSLYFELLDCDSTYTAALSPPLLSPFAPPAPLTSLDPLTLAPSQSRAALAAYFRSVEPSLGMYASRACQVTFQETCLKLWNGPAHGGVNGHGDGGENGGAAMELDEGTARPRAWWSLYLATVALGVVALAEGEAGAVGLPEGEAERGRVARGLAEEAARGLGREGESVPSLFSLRAALLLVAFELGGLTGMPDASSVLSSLPLIVGAAYDLGLNCEPGEGEEADEKRGLWWRVFELEAAWSPLLDKRLSLSPFSFTTRPSLVSSSTSPPSPSPLHSSLLHTSKLSFLLNSPHSPTPLDLFPLVDEYEQLVRSIAAGAGDGLEGLVRKCVGVRLRAVRDEVGERATEGEEKAWEDLAYDLLTTPPDLILRVDRFQQLLAATTYIHALVMVALRLHLFPSLPSHSFLVAHLVALLPVLKTSPWTLHLHQTIHRGVVVLESLISMTSGGISDEAHNPRVSLAPKDFKYVQEIISTERRVVETSQRVAAERNKAAEALREWGNAEGPDLGDVLTKLCTLYDWLAKAEVQACEHQGSSRLKFKEIRTKEENLSTLKKSRDSLAGRIDAQERKVSKMKEENKDLPNARQRLHDMHQEMVGLEHSVLSEETRLGDFKRSATREALSLKLGAMLELAEKTVIVAELGKLIVDMLPTDVTEPGEQRAYYDGFQRTEELLGEAQRCLQDVVFNPAPISEPFAQQNFDEGGGHPTNQFDTPAVDEQQQHYQQQQQQQHPDFQPDHQYATRQYTDSSLQQQQTPHSYASPQTYASPAHNPQSPGYDDGSFRRNSKRFSGTQVLPEQPAPHAGPQLQPLPDFRPLSVVNTPTSEPHRGLGPAPAAHAQSEVGLTPQVDGYASRSPGLAPPVGQSGWEQNRTSLAYLGEAPPSEQLHDQHGNHSSHEDVEAREAREAREMAAIEAQEKEEEALRAKMQQEQQYQQQWRYETQDYGAGEGQSSAPHEEYAHPQDENHHPTGLTAPSSGLNNNPLSPIVEVATPAMTVPDSPHSSAPPGQQTYEYQPLRNQQHQQQQQQRSASPPPIEYVRSPSAAEKRGQYGEEHEAYQSPPPSAGQQSATYAQQQQQQQQHEIPSPSPSSPASAVPPPSSAPLSPPATATSPPPSSPAYTSTQTYAAPPGPPPPPSAFEPRPLTPSGQRRPVQIRPAPEAALGSKYGDVYVPSPGLASPRDGGAGAGYFGGAGAGAGGDAASAGGKKITAGAFRRPVPGAGPGAGVGGAGRGFAPSGYGPEQQQPQLHRSGPSESELIAAQYRSAIPLSPNVGPGGPGGGMEHEMQLAGEGELPQPGTPSFDTRPLQVNKGRGGGGAGSNVGVGRSGTLPSHLNTSHGRSASYGDSGSSTINASSAAAAAPPSPGLPYDQPTSPGSQEGFGSNRFVTRLD